MQVEGKDSRSTIRVPLSPTHISFCLSFWLALSYIFCNAFCSKLLASFMEGQNKIFIQNKNYNVAINSLTIQNVNSSYFLCEGLTVGSLAS